MAILLTTSYQLVSTISLDYGEIRTYAKYTSQNTETNQTTYLLRQRYYTSQAGGVSFASATGTLRTEDGATNTKTYGYTTMPSGETTIQEIERVSTHYDNGNGRVKTVTTTWDASFGGSGSTSVDITFPKIDRYPIILSATDFNDEENPTITYTTTSGFDNATYQACISVDGTTDTISYRSIDLNAGSYTFTLTNTERNTLRNATSNSNTLSVQFILKTTVGTTNYYSKVSRTMNIINANPTFSHSEVETNQKVITLLGSSSASTIIQNASVVRTTVVATALKGSSIANVKVTSGANYSQTLTTSPYVFDIPFTDASSFNIYVTDSRGNQQYILKTIPMIFYQSVDIITYNFVRQNPTSSNINLNLEARYYPTTLGSSENPPTVKWKLGENGTYVTIPSSYYDTSETNKLKISNCVLSNVLSHEQSGTFYISIEDKLTNDENNMIVNKGIATFEAGEFDLQVNGDLIIADTDGENGVNVLNKINNLLSWTLKDNTTGTTSISLPSSFNEIMCIVKISNNDNVQIPLIIPYEHLTTSSQGFNSGYYGAGQGTSAYCRVVATKTSASISQAYLNANNVTNSSALYVYYR